MSSHMPKDNEVDEKVKPVAWIVTNGGETCEPWLEYEQSEVDALPAVCIAEPLYSAATVAELRAEVAEQSARADKWKALHDAVSLAHEVQAKSLTRALDRAEAAERRVGELEAVLRRISTMNAADDSDYGFNEWGEADCFNQVRVLAAEALTGADPT